jgi:NAD(P)-dependent dehydrogenase (short-subunit alcohol dehydrogenase family)
MTQTPRNVLITGGSRGIGAATALAFATLGDRVAVHYGNSESAALAVRDSLPGDGHIVVQAELADPSAITAMVAETVTAFGSIDVLVNNAGIFEAHPIDETDYATWQAAWARTLNINLVAVANTIHQALPHIPRDGSGRIINVGSRGAFRGEPVTPAYGASKAALTSMGQSLAKYLGAQKISVATVAPGFVETDMAREELDGANGDFRRNESTWGRVAHPDEVAAAIVYLASARAQFATGTVIDINGGSYLRM